MEQFKEFVIKYFKIIVVVLSFSLTLYIQHINNTAQIAKLETKCAGMETEIKNQYDRINAMKLDKSVFEANSIRYRTTCTKFVRTFVSFSNARERTNRIIEHNRHD